MIIAQLMRFHFNRSNLPEENLSKYIRTLNLAIEFASLNIAITATYYSQLLCLDGVLEFRTHIFSSKIVYHELPEFDASTPSESAVAPESLQSRTQSSLVRHMRVERRLDPGSRVDLLCLPVS